MRPRYMPVLDRGTSGLTQSGAPMLGYVLTLHLGCFSKGLVNWGQIPFSVPAPHPTRILGSCIPLAVGSSHHSSANASHSLPTAPPATPALGVLRNQVRYCGGFFHVHVHGTGP